MGGFCFPPVLMGGITHPCGSLMTAMAVSGSPTHGWVTHDCHGSHEGGTHGWVMTAISTDGRHMGGAYDCHQY